METDNINAVLSKLLRQLALPINESELKSELLTHPDYPSLLAISDVLNNFNIQNSAISVDNNYISLLSAPFIAHTKDDTESFFLVHNIDNNSVLVSNERFKNRIMEFSEFKKIFTGIVLTINDSKSYSQKLYNQILRFKIPVIGVVLLILIITTLLTQTTYFTNFKIEIFMITILKTIGLMVSTLLIISTIDHNNPYVSKVCRGISKSNCNSILESTAANALSWLSWSELGFFYFLGTLLITFFMQEQVFKFELLTGMNFLCLPYTVYSITYQIRHRLWCVLCCTVQVLFWLEFFVLNRIQFKYIEYFNWKEINILLLCFVLPFFLWKLVKPLILQLQQLRPLKNRLKIFQYNVDLFNNLLLTQPSYPLPSLDWSITLGKSESKNVIVLVINPICGSCSTTYLSLEKLLEMGLNIQARILFSSDNQAQDTKAKLCRHFIALSELADDNIVKNALNAWFSQKQKTYEQLAEVYPVFIDSINNTIDKLEKQRIWCKKSNVLDTPKIFLNGYLLPDIYRLIDLKYLI